MELHMPPVRRRRAGGYRFLSGHACVALIIALFVAHALHAQDMWDVYRQFLPASADTTPGLRPQLETLLQAKGSIHPDLLFYYVSYYQLVLTDSAAVRGIPRAAWPELLGAVERSYLQRRSAWFSTQCRSLDTMNVEPEIRRWLTSLCASQSYAVAHASGPTPTLPASDSAMMDYLAACFIDPSHAPAFVPGTAYAGLRMRVEAAGVDMLVAGCGPAAEPDPEAAGPGTIARSWYLFESHGVDIRPSLMSSITCTMTRSGTTTPLSRFGISAVVAPIDYMFIFEQSMPIKGTPLPLEVRQQIHGLSAGLSVNYTWYLRPYYGTFSYVDVRLQGIIMVGRPSLELFSGYSQDTDEGVYTVRRTLQLTSGSWSSSSQTAIMLRLATPMVVLFDRHPIEFGLHCGATRVAYHVEYAYKYQERWMKSNGQTVTGELKNTISPQGGITDVQWRLVISPSVNAIFRITGSLACGLSVGLRNSYVSLDLGL